MNQLSPWEQITLAAIVEAAEAGLVAPTCDELVGYDVRDPASFYPHQRLSRQIPRASRQIGVDDRDQLLGRLRPGIVARRIRIEHVLADMVLDHLGDEPVERAAAGGRLLENARAFGVGLDRALDRLELAAQPLEPVEELLFFFRDVTHGSASHAS